MGVIQGYPPGQAYLAASDEDLIKQAREYALDLQYRLQELQSRGWIVGLDWGQCSAYRKFDSILVTARKQVEL
jgi:hypothetical protein